MRVVYNSTGIGIYLSKVGLRYYKELSGIQLDSKRNAKLQKSLKIDRSDPFLTQTVTDLGQRASNMLYAHLLIKDIPDEISYRIVISYGREKVLFEPNDISKSDSLLNEIDRLEKLELEYEQLLQDIRKKKGDLITAQSKTYIDVSV